MKENKILKINGTPLDKKQLESHLEKIATNHNLVGKSAKNTYPIPHLIESFKIIQEVYNLLNEHLKLGISIHPAGEWLLDNLYVIEECVKQIEKELTLKKYTSFLGIANGGYKGFARIYVLAAEIVAFTDNRIEKEDLENYLISYQTKKTLSMEEIWNIGIFLEIAIIENIREVCEKIYTSQMEKYKAENIVERLVENKTKQEQIFKNNNFKKVGKNILNDMGYSFVEYMSYILKRYGKKGYSYLKALEETVELTGTTVTDVIKKEHFDIAVRKVSIGNSITSIKKIQRMNFLEIFEKINGVEDLLKKDPSEVYGKMDDKTKEYYRNKIKEISKKTKISEIYIAKKLLELANKNEEEKKRHIGYFLIDEGIYDLYKSLKIKQKNKINIKEKTKIYISVYFISTTIIALLLANLLNRSINNIYILILSFILFFIPASEIVNQILSYILSKTVKPKIIPKLDFSKGITKENKTMVVIPTIINSREKVKNLMKKLEIFYLANKSENIYFCLLGDCTESDKKEEKIDLDLIEEGNKQVKILNTKYESTSKIPIFNFIYRKREWNEKEGSYLGWERKRGMLTQLNEYLLGNIENPFRENTLFLRTCLKNSNGDEDKREIKDELKSIKYIITLDADTDLILGSAFQLVGAMAHILNKPEIDEKTNIVKAGYGIMQPRVGIDLKISNYNLFTKIFAGAGGIDSYTNAISDLYQDNFKEGIFTGKGIYDLKVYSKVLKNVIPENTVLSHDLLEGCYLRCGLASDIMLMDGYPTKYNSFMNRLSRWIRGDVQILSWISPKKNLNLLSRFKILDNIRRSLLEISIIFSIIFISITGYIFNKNILGLNLILLGVIIIPFILEIFNYIVVKKTGEEKTKTFTPKISGIKGSLIRGILTLGCMPYKAYISLKSIIISIYRLIISKKHLLEWMTSEEAEKQAKEDMFSYVKQMSINIILGFICVFSKNIFIVLLGIFWMIIPIIMSYISKKKKEEKPIEKLNKEEKEYVKEIAKRTWEFFQKYLTKENNFLITDNYQEDRKEKIVLRTSSTNIGLSLLAVVSAYDMGFIDENKTVELLKEMLFTIDSLPKWNGHLYNWYQIKTKEPLIPRYISTVDSGNFIGYLFVLKTFLKEINIKNNRKEEIDILLNLVDKLIKNTDFKVLYNNELQMFSIGFNAEENKLTDSYYDLLASEARQASLVAIAKKDVSSKHWNSLSRTLTRLGKYKGLISWSGTAFEYLMPDINIPRYEGSLLDESCKFMIMSQKEYSKKLNIPWGISEAAFNLKDLKSNYQYKAFGIPWLGLKRGLGDELVVSSYGGVLAILDCPKEEVENLKRLEKEGMFNKFGFYESIDYTPQRVEKGKTSSVVKTYMAHHQGLILLSINNLFNDKILQKRFMKNPEIESVSILLQETMPETGVITKEKKEKIEKLKYKDYENYIKLTFNKLDERLITGNVISSENYVIAMNQKGEGLSKYKDIYINRFKPTNDYSQGIFFVMKNIKTKRIWSSNYSFNDKNNYQISFMPDKCEQEMIEGNIKTKIKTTISSNAPVEIRRITLENKGNDEEIVELTSYFEPVLSRKEDDYAHPVFNNLFLITKFDEKQNSLIIKRKKREKNNKEIYLEVGLSTNCETIGDLEYEINETKFIGRGNFGIPKMIINSIPLSKKIGLVTEPIVVLKRTVKIKPNEEINCDFILSVGEDEKQVKENFEKYKNYEYVKNEFELSKARVEAESRYLRVKGKEIELYQKILSYIIFDNSVKSERLKKINLKEYKQSNLWKYGISGDLPIILVKIRDVNDNYIIKEILKAYEFFRTKNMEIEIVILDEEKHSYENYVREEIENEILNRHMSYLKNVRAGIFTLVKGEVDKNDIELLDLISVITIDSKKGGLENNIKDLEEEYLDKYKLVNEDEPNIIMQTDEDSDIDILENYEKLKYYNEYGGFSEDGKEYLIRVNKENRLPTVWSNILANEKFGTVVTESMGGYTWFKNSRLNRVTAWSNNPCLDDPSEVIYVKEENGKAWSLGLNPMPDNRNYNIIYGFGYTKYIHKSCGIEQELEVFVPKEDSCKISILNLKNTTPNRKKLKLYYYIKPVLGEDEIKTAGYLETKFDKNNNIVYTKNLYKREEQDYYIYISSSEKIQSFTGDKNSFLGSYGLSNPQGLKKVRLNNDTGLGKKTCMVFTIDVEIESFSSKEISFVLGADEKLINCKDISYKYSKLNNCKQELLITKNSWRDILERLQVYTPIEAINILLNGWVAYQTIVSRLLGRSGYYQSGGAFGFRDQLQDTLGLKYLDVNIMKNQIIKHSKHQFTEGDVEHWWHDETMRGIRTRFSDDLLWLVFLTIEYINFTGDKSILDIETPFLKGEILQEGVDEKYDKYLESDEKASIYNHCIRAIEKSLNFGEHGLPKIGSGDWNDGFSTVGNKGKGESVWLGFFLYYILDNFIPIIKEVEENNGEYNSNLLTKYEKIKQDLKRALNSKAWDGRWFKRAYMDDGNVLGTMENEECRIDGISQSWSVISNAGDNDKKYISMESLENHLIDKENGIIKLLDPPFEKSKLEPGYIKAYLPGVRENGGQYTHGAIWVIIAESLLGFGDKALEFYRMINPIEHSRTKEASNKYKVEPYVIAADVYGQGELIGRGGWTWYTGSSSWYYKAGIEYILGLKIKNGYFSIEPCIPKEWKEYQIQYKWKDSIYHINIKNPNNKNSGVTKVLLNGSEVENKIKLDGTRNIYHVEVIL